MPGPCGGTPWDPAEGWDSPYRDVLRGSPSRAGRVRVFWWGGCWHRVLFPLGFGLGSPQGQKVFLYFGEGGEGLGEGFGMVPVVVASAPTLCPCCCSGCAVWGADPPQTDPPGPDPPRGAGEGASGVAGEGAPSPGSARTPASQGTKLIWGPK